MKIVEYQCGTRKEILEYLESKNIKVIKIPEEIRELEYKQYFQFSWNLVSTQIENMIRSGSPLVSITYNQFEGCIYGGKPIIQNIREQFIVEDFAEIQISNRLEALERMRENVNATNTDEDENNNAFNDGGR